MEINNKFIKALKSSEVIILAIMCIGFILVQAFYPKASAFQAIGFTLALVVQRVYVKGLGAKDSQVIE